MDAPDPSSLATGELKAVTLDLWQTLISEADGTSHSATRRDMRVRYVDEVLLRNGFFYDKAQIAQAVGTVGEMLNSDHDLGLDMAFSERVRQFLGLIDENLSDSLGEEAVADVGQSIDRTFLESPPQVIDGVYEALDALKSKGMKLALISNTGFTSPEMYHRWFSEIGLLDYFDHMAFSNGSAAAKPSPHIFNPVLESLGIEAGQAIHVGDNLYTDVAGAAALGMRTAWISGLDSREPVVAPDYTMSHVSGLTGIVERWKATESVV